MAVGRDEAIDGIAHHARHQPEDHRQSPGAAEVFGDPEYRSRSHQHSAWSVTGRLEPDHRIDVRELWMLLDHAAAERPAERGEGQFAGRGALPPGPAAGRPEPDHRIDVRELWMLLDHAAAERTAERGEVQFAGRVALQHELNARGAKAAGPVVQEHWGHRVVPDSTP